MYKNQLQELAQRSCFNLPSYTCVREGPDHAPRFKSAVNFNGEVFESPGFFTTLRQAEHAAAEVALQALSRRGPSHSLAARVLDETGVYKNLLQEVSQRVGASLPSYTTVRSGLGHLPVFTCTVELAGIQFTGEPAKNKKQAEKNAAMAAWSSLKQLAKEAASSSSSDTANNDELEHVTIARALLNYRLKEKMAMANNPYATPFPKMFPVQLEKKPSQMQPPATGSKILPLIRPNSTTRSRPTSPSMVDRATPSLPFSQHENRSVRPHKFPAAGAAPYMPVRHFSMPYHSMVQPVTMRTAVPVFSPPPPLPPPSMHQLNRPVRMASPVCVRPTVPILAVPPPVPAISPALPVVASMNPPISFQLKKQSSPVVASRDPLLSIDQVKEQPPVAEALIDCPATPVQVKNSPLAVTVVAEALIDCPATPVQVKNSPLAVTAFPVPASSVRIPDDQLKELPPVSAMIPPVQTENVDGPVKDPEGVEALEHLERLEI